MKKIIVSPSLYLLLRVIVGGLFVVAGVLKLADPGAFAAAIDGYGLVSWRTTKLLSHILPVVEILTGLGVIFDIKGALGLIVAQLLVFVGVIGYAVHLGLDVDCGCFGPSDLSENSGSLKQTLYRDGLLILACVFLYWQRCTAAFSPRSPIRLFKR